MPWRPRIETRRRARERKRGEQSQQRKDCALDRSHTCPRALGIYGHPPQTDAPTDFQQEQHAEQQACEAVAGSLLCERPNAASVTATAAMVALRFMPGTRSELLLESGSVGSVS